MKEEQEALQQEKKRKQELAVEKKHFEKSFKEYEKENCWAQEGEEHYRNYHSGRGHREFDQCSYQVPRSYTLRKSK